MSRAETMRRPAGWRRDVLAGMTVAVLLVPQAMAYAMLAGLPPVTGLYAATLPLLVYALWGSSRELAVGPVAMLALLTAAACAPVAAPGTPAYLAAAGVVTLLAGVLHVALGVARAGRLTPFVSLAVIGGFTSAGAILIGLTQVGPLCGLPPAAGAAPAALVADLAGRWREAHLPTLALGLGCLAVLLGMRRTWPRAPGPLLVVVLSMLAVAGLGLGAMGVRVVGEVPAGLPRIVLPSGDLSLWQRLWPAAALMVFVGYMESLAVARWIAAREKYRLNPNRELLALGAANLASGLLGGCPVTGGFSRTAVNYQAGARSPLASLVTAVMVLAALLVLTPLFRFLPQAALAAVVVSAVLGLVRFKEARDLFRINRADGVLWLATFGVTLVWGVKQGLAAGIVLSLAQFLARSARPRVAVLGYLPEQDAFRDVARYPAARVYPGLLLMRVDASLYFANMEFVLDRLRDALAGPGVRRVILEMAGVNAMDAVAAIGLASFMDAYAPRGIGFAFVGLKQQVREVAERAGWARPAGAAALAYTSLHQAVRALHGAPP